MIDDFVFFQAAVIRSDNYIVDIETAVYAGSPFLKSFADAVSINELIKTFTIVLVFTFTAVSTFIDYAIAVSVFHSQISDMNNS